MLHFILQIAAASIASCSAVIGYMAFETLVSGDDVPPAYIIVAVLAVACFLLTVKTATGL